MDADRGILAALAAIAVVGLALSYLFFSGPFYSFDDMDYITFAHQMLNGTFNLTSSPYAYGFLVPFSIAASFSAFGINVPASILPAMVEYLAIIAIAFAAARKMYGNSVGIVSALLVATAPFVVGYSTRVLPDMAVGVSAGISVLLFVYAGDDKRGSALYFLSGAFAALTIYFKLIGLAFILFFAVALAVRSSGKRKTGKNAGLRAGYALVGAAAVLALYAAIFQVYGSGIAAAVSAYGRNQVSISPTTLGDNINALIVSIGFAGPVSRYAPYVDPQIFPLGLMCLLAFLGTVMGLAEKGKGIAFLSVILWGVFFYLFFGTVTLTKYAFITVISRYFIAVAVPMAVLASYAICKMSDTMSRRTRTARTRFIALFLIAAIVSNIPAYLALYNYNMIISGSVGDFSSLLRYMSANAQGGRPDLLVSDNGPSVSFLRFIQGYGAGNETIIPMDFFDRNSVTALVHRECATGAKAYFALVYANSSEASYDTVYQDWVIPQCSMTEAGAFQDKQAADEPYNSMNVEIRLYKMG
jgi:4-amino-4-deoxy-L-arabinose transferase-like glycosyltransferase